MPTIQTVIDENNYNKRCAEAIQTLKLFMRNAEEQLESSLPLSTLKLIVDSIGDQP